MLPLFYSRDCSVYSATKELSESTDFKFGSTIGTDSPIDNPIMIDIDNYEGITLEISVYDADTSLIKPYEQVKETTC